MLKSHQHHHLFLSMPVHRHLSAWMVFTLFLTALFCIQPALAIESQDPSTIKKAVEEQQVLIETLQQKKFNIQESLDLLKQQASDAENKNFQLDQQRNTTWHALRTVTESMWQDPTITIEQERLDYAAALKAFKSNQKQFSTLMETMSRHQEQLASTEKALQNALAQTVVLKKQLAKAQLARLHAFIQQPIEVNAEGRSACELDETLGNCINRAMRNARAQAVQIWSEQLRSRFGEIPKARNIVDSLTNPTNGVVEQIEVTEERWTAKTSFQVTLNAHVRGGHRPFKVQPVENTAAVDIYTTDGSRQPVNISVNPADSRIRILNIKPQFVQGILLPKGRYHVEVARVGYHPQRRWISVEDSAISTDFALQPADILSPLNVVTTPEQAQVRILNIHPPYKPGILLPPTNYHVEVSKPGYRTQRRWITMEARETEVAFNLIPTR
ncbi:MAG: hypothetical protein HQL54_07985 [Magnetococcales bacterium]|nr:hypothetical protein [Magnetococcales bacterium]